MLTTPPLCKLTLQSREIPVQFPSWLLLPSQTPKGVVINTLYLTIIIKTYIPFSSGSIKSEEHIFPTHCLTKTPFVTLRSDLYIFNDGAPLISWWCKNTATREKDDHLRLKSMFASGHLQSVISISHTCIAETAPSDGCRPSSYVERCQRQYWIPPEMVLLLHQSRHHLCEVFGLRLSIVNICCQRTVMRSGTLALVTTHWFNSQSLCVISIKNDLVSLMEWLILTSCCNKNTLEWLEMYYHSSSTFSLASCSVIAVRLIRNLHYIHTQL